MKEIILNISVLLLSGSINLYAQKFISKSLLVSGNQSDEEIFMEEPRTLIISNNTYEIELPDKTVLKGKLTFTSSEILDGKKVNIYNTEDGCPLVIGEDNIFFNLMRTHNIAISYYLNNYIKPPEKTEEEKQREFEKFEYEHNIDNYGKFSADCIKEGKVKIGMKGLAVLEILGIPNTINQTETENTLIEQLVYDTKYVYLTNGIVTTIQSRIEIK